jgi:EmrB/QacA subfamily drug resistance transporter
VNPVLSRADARSVVIGLMLAILLGALEQTIVSVALPKMSAELQGLDLLAWVVSGYLLAMAVSTPIYGKLGDLYGRRAVLSVAIGIFLASSVACALAQSMPMLVAARVLQGIGGGGLISVAQAIIADVVAPRERGRYQGYISGAYALASVAGPMLGGVLTQHLSWRWIFWINLPLGLAALFISRRALALLPVPHVKRPIDTIGAMLLSAGLTLLLIGITRVGQGFSWVAADNLQLFALGAVFLVAFVWQEGRAEEPLIPLSIFRHPTVVISCIVLFVVFFELVSLTVLIPLRLQMTSGAGVDRAAFQLVPLTFAVPCASFASGRLVAHTGRYKPFLLAGAIAVPFAMLALAIVDPRATLPAALCMVLAGIGLGMQVPASMVAVQSVVSSRHIGIATATTAFFRSFGAAIGIAILTAMLLAALRENIPAITASHVGAEFLNDMMGDALATIAENSRAQLAAAVHDCFQKVFMIGAGVALVPAALLVLIADETLPDHR